MSFDTEESVQRGESQTRREPDGALRVGFDALVDWTARALETVGIAPADARPAAEVLVRTDARGFPTHGLARLKSYLAKFEDGELKADAHPEWELRNGVLTYRADRQLGQIAGPAAVAKAADFARDRAVTTCVLQDPGHLGALGVVVLGAAERGFVTLILQAGSPLLALPGSGIPLIGNNPFALAAPRRNGPPLVIDMSCGVVARGNLLLKARTGEPIPEGWAVDVDGNPTTDATEALKGAMLPFGDYKGLALAMLVEVLGGALTGAPYPDALDTKARLGVAAPSPAVLLVINPDLFSGRESYDAYMDAWTERISTYGAGVARIPGERAAHDEAGARRNGIALSPSIAGELSALGDKIGVPFG
jgi:LDH2 family malate/lactate/ureidoglycolate dehydrogenase